MQRVENITPCAQCPLQKLATLRPHEPAEIAYLQEFKTGELAVERGGLLIDQGHHSPHLYTLLDGVLLRYRSLDDGRRQIVNFMFPGDLVGLQGAFDDASSHSVEALLPSRLCVFERERFVSLIQQHPQLGYDIVWLAAKEETQLEEHIVALGQRTARERVAYLAVWLVNRALLSGMADEHNRVELPITQAQIADMLGLSLVHTNRTLKALLKDGLVQWRPGEICIPDMAAACDYAKFDRKSDRLRRFI